MVDSKMANNEESVYNDPNFAIICSFVDKFGELNGITDFSIVDLQEKLEEAKEIGPEWIDFHVRLLRKAGKKSVSNERWEKALIKFCHSYSKVDAWEIERFGYKKAKLSVKISVLKHLLEAQFDGNSKFKAEVNKFTAQQLRLLPMGRDVNGQMYWCQTDKDFNLKVYREDQDDETWELIVRERTELAELIAKLTSGTGFKKEESSTTSENDDSKDSSCAAKRVADKPKLDTGQDGKGNENKQDVVKAAKSPKTEIKSESESESTDEEEEKSVKSDPDTKTKLETSKVESSLELEKPIVEDLKTHTVQVKMEAETENCSAQVETSAKMDSPVKTETLTNDKAMKCEVSVKEEIPTRVSVIKMVEKVVEMPGPVHDDNIAENNNKAESKEEIATNTQETKVQIISNVQETKVQTISSAQEPKVQVHLLSTDEPMDLNTKQNSQKQHEIKDKSNQDTPNIEEPIELCKASETTVSLTDNNEKYEDNSVCKETNDSLLSPKTKITDELKEKMKSERMIPFKKREIPKDVDTCNAPSSASPLVARDLVCSSSRETCVNYGHSDVMSNSREIAMKIPEVQTRNDVRVGDSELPLEALTSLCTKQSAKMRTLRDCVEKDIPLVTENTSISPVKNVLAKSDLPSLFQPQFLVNKPSPSKNFEMASLVGSNERSEKALCLSLVSTEKDSEMKSLTTEIESPECGKKEESLKSKNEITESPKIIPAKFTNRMQESVIAPINDSTKNTDAVESSAVLDLSRQTENKSAIMESEKVSKSTEEKRYSTDNFLLEIQRKSSERTKIEDAKNTPTHEREMSKHYHEKEGRRSSGRELEKSLARLRERQEIAKVKEMKLLKQPDVPAVPSVVGKSSAAGMPANDNCASVENKCKDTVAPVSKEDLVKTEGKKDAGPISEKNSTKADVDEKTEKSPNKVELMEKTSEIVDEKSTEDVEKLAESEIGLKASSSSVEQNIKTDKTVQSNESNAVKEEQKETKREIDEKCETSTNDEKMLKTLDTEPMQKIKSSGDKNKKLEHSDSSVPAEKLLIIETNSSTEGALLNEKKVNVEKSSEKITDQETRKVDKSEKTEPELRKSVIKAEINATTDNAKGQHKQVPKEIEVEEKEDTRTSELSKVVSRPVESNKMEISDENKHEPSEQDRVPSEIDKTKEHLDTQPDVDKYVNAENLNDKSEIQNVNEKQETSDLNVNDPTTNESRPTVSVRGSRGRGKSRGRGGSRGRGARNQTKTLPTPEKTASTEVFHSDSSQEKPENSEDSPPWPGKKGGRKQGRGRGRAVVDIDYNDEPAAPKRSQRLQAQREKQQEVERQIEEERQLLAEFEKQQKEEDNRRKQEQKQNTTKKTRKRRKKGRGRQRRKVKDEDYEEDDDDDDEEDEEDDDDDDKENRKKRLKKKRRKQKRRRKGNNPWDYSSDTSSSSSEQDEHHDGEDDEDEELVFNDKSDHEFSPESESEVESNQPMEIRRARTARKAKSESDEEESEEQDDDKPCSKCGNYDHPEWILLCDKCNAGFHTACLRPTLLIIPDGDWFCPPCEHRMLLVALQEHLKFLEQAFKKKEREEMRKKRLAYVGINLDNVLKPEKKEDQSDEGEEEENQPKRSCRARRDISYQFKEYDAMIQSAIQEEIIAERGAGMGKGKDISNITDIDDENQDEPVKEDDGKDEEGNSRVGESAAMATVASPTSATVPNQTASPPAPTDTTTATTVTPEPATTAVTKISAAAARKRRKHRRLNDLDSTDEEEEDNDSDEDFKGSSDSNTPQSEEEDDDDEDYVEESEDSWQATRSRSSRHRRTRRSKRSKDYDSDFVVESDDSEESDSCRVKRRAASKRVSYRELSDSEENEGAGWKKSSSQKRRRIDNSSDEGSDDSDWRELHRKEKAETSVKSTGSRIKRRWASESDSESDIDDSDSVSKLRGKKRSKKDLDESSDDADDSKKKKHMRIKDFEKESDDESDDDNEGGDDDDDDDDDEEEEDDDDDDEEEEEEEEEEGEKANKVDTTKRTTKQEETAGGENEESDEESKKVSSDGTPISLSLDAALTPLTDMSPNQRSVIMTLKLTKKDGEVVKSGPMGSNAQNASGAVNAERDPRGGITDTGGASVIAGKDNVNKKIKVPPTRVEGGLRPLVPPPQLPMDYRGPPPNPLRPSLMEPPMQRSSPSKLMLLDACPSRASPHTRFTMLDLPYGHRTTPPTSIHHRSTPPNIHHYDPKIERPQALSSPNRPGDHPSPHHPPTHPLPPPPPPPPPPYMADYPAFMAPPYYPPNYGQQGSPHERYSPQGYHPAPPPPPPLHGQPHPPFPPPYHQQSPHYSYGPEGYPEDDQYEGHSQPPYPPPYGNFSSPAEGSESQTAQQQQHNGSYAVNSLLQRTRTGEGTGEEDEFNGVNDLVSYITGSHENQL